jgi:hypothetical protein
MRGIYEASTRHPAFYLYFLAALPARPGTGLVVNEARKHALMWGLPALYPPVMMK